MLEELTPEQWAIIGMAAGAGATLIIQKCPKPYAWLKVKVAWAHRKMDAVALPEGAGDDVKAAYAAAEGAVAALDAALEDDKISYAEVITMVSKALTLVKKIKALL